MLPTTQVEEMINDPLTEVFVAKNFSSYKRKWEKLKENKKASWNWAAFFLGPLWAIYRKMYLVAFLYFLASSVLEMIPVLGSLLAIVIWILFSVYAHYLYYRFVKNKIAKIKAEVKDETLLQDTIKRKGGVNVWAPIVVAILFVVFIILMTVWLTALVSNPNFSAGV